MIVSAGCSRAVLSISWVAVHRLILRWGPRPKESSVPAQAAIKTSFPALLIRRALLGDADGGGGGAGKGGAQEPGTPGNKPFAR